MFEEPTPTASEPAGIACRAGRLSAALFPYLVKFWIWVSALAVLAGWTLSAVGQLNRTGYTLFFLAVAVAYLAWRQGSRRPGTPEVLNWQKLRLRFRRPLPAAFAVLALLILIGGVIYPPTNYTGLNYRVGRVLQWLGHQQWWWIHTPSFRMNDRACGMEWLYAPVLLFTRSDRALFLINYLPYLLLPGMIFSVFRQLGVRARVAWNWMWLLPTGYNFLLQAGSIANDTFPTAYALAALHFILRARASGKISDLWYSLVAAALLTGAKAGNLPLLLPWAVIACTVAPLWKRSLPATAPFLLVGTAVSFVPTAILNSIYCHDWTGASLELPNMTMKHPLIGIWGNAFQLARDNLAPPVLPVAGWWNAHATSILPGYFVRAIQENFTSGYLQIGELPTEDWAGLGLGLSLLLAISVAAGFRIRQKASGSPSSGPPTLSRPLITCVYIAIWLAMLVYCMKSGMENAARIIAPYYPLLIATLVAGAAQSEIVRRRWWRALACATLLPAFVVLALSPDRPLWPAKRILQEMAARHPNAAAVARALNVYTVYSRRNDALADVRLLLPPNLATIGLVADGDDCDVSLWRPLGSRRVEHFLLTDPPEMLRTNVQYVVVGGWYLNSNHMQIDDWLQRNHAELVGATNLTTKVSEGPQNWYVTRIIP
jgi:hypothetical protein